MKREIKFRAWIPKLKRIIYIGSHKNDTAVWICEDGFNVVDHFTGVHESMGTDEDGVILMQFTGLKDKNGKEIYEGDIVSHSLDNSTIPLSVVSFEDGMFVFSDKEYTTELIESLDYCEVIGNIYENPELLNQ